MCATQRKRDNMTRASTDMFFLFLQLIFKIVSPRRFIDRALRQFAVNRAVRQKSSAEAAVKHQRPSQLFYSLTAVFAPHFFFFFLTFRLLTLVR